MGAAPEDPTRPKHVAKQKQRQAEAERAVELAKMRESMPLSDPVAERERIRRLQEEREREIAAEAMGMGDDDDDEGEGYEDNYEDDEDAAGRRKPAKPVVSAPAVALPLDKQLEGLPIKGLKAWETVAEVLSVRARADGNRLASFKLAYGVLSIALADNHVSLDDVKKLLAIAEAAKQRHEQAGGKGGAGKGRSGPAASSSSSGAAAAGAGAKPAASKKTGYAVVESDRDIMDDYKAGRGGRGAADDDDDGFGSSAKPSGSTRGRGLVVEDFM